VAGVLCPECGHSATDGDLACPRCSAPLPLKPRPKLSKPRPLASKARRLLAARTPVRLSMRIPCPKCAHHTRAQAAYCDACGTPLRPEGNEASAGPNPRGVPPGPSGGPAETSAYQKYFAYFLGPRVLPLELRAVQGILITKLILLTLAWCGQNIRKEFGYSFSTSLWIGANVVILQGLSHRRLWAWYLELALSLMGVGALLLLLVSTISLPELETDVPVVPIFLFLLFLLGMTGASAALLIICWARGMYQTTCKSCKDSLPEVNEAWRRAGFCSNACLEHVKRMSAG